MPKAKATRTRGTLIADGEEATEAVPSIVVPVEVEAPFRPAPVEAGHVAVTIAVDPRRAEGDDRELALDVGERRPERQQLLDRRGAQAVRVEVRLGLARARHLVEVDELEVDLDETLALDLEVARADV